MIRLWDIEDPRSPKLLGRLRGGHINIVTSVTFSPDGSLLASASNDLSIRLWDVKGRQQFGPLLVRDRRFKTGVAFSPDGKTLASCSVGGVIHLYDTDVQAWPKRARGIANRNFSWEEWEEYFPDKAYRRTFPDLPAPPLSDAAIRVKLMELKGIQLSDAKRRSAYEQIVRLALATDDASVNNSACWQGSLDGVARIVLPAGKRAVRLAPENPSYRDTRGLALALTGDFRGAIDDFQFYVEAFKKDERRKDSVRQRQEWITVLREGRSPFDEKTLKALSAR
jgi:hypothetical protein